MCKKQFAALARLCYDGPMKRKLRGLKRTDIQLDFDLYRVPVPIPGVAGDELSVVDIHPPGVNRTMVFIHGYAGCAETW